MIRNLVILLFLFGSIHPETGWIFDYTFQTQHKVLQMVSYQKDCLLTQTTQSLFITNFQNPDQIQRTIILNETQNVHISVNQANNFYAYLNKGFVNKVIGNKSTERLIPTMASPSNLVRSENLIYFYNPRYSQNLLVYNLLSEQIQLGPLISINMTEVTNSVMEISHKKGLLFISLLDCFFVIDLGTLVIRQIINTTFEIGIIVASQSGQFIAVSSVNSRNAVSNLYRLNQDSNTFFTIISFGQSDAVMNNEGFSFNQQLKICKDVSIGNGKLMRIMEFDCSQSYDKVVDKLVEFPDSWIYVSAVSVDKQYVYSIIGLQSLFLVKYKIKEDRFEIIFNKQIGVKQTRKNISIEIVKVYTNRIMVMVNNLGQISVLNLQTLQLMCVEEIAANIKQMDERLLFTVLDQSQNILYLSGFPLMNVLFWINLQNCKCYSKRYAEQIGQFWLLHNKTYIKFLSPSPNLFALDEQKQIIKQSGHKLLCLNPLICQDKMYGLVLEAGFYRIIRYDEHFEPSIQVYVYCSSNLLELHSGPDYLQLQCNNVYHQYTTDLQYLGSSGNSLQSAWQYSLTFDPSLKFQAKSGKLIKIQYKIWNMSVVQFDEQLTISSHFNFFNKTDAFYIAFDLHESYLYHIVFDGLHFSIKKRAQLNLDPSLYIFSRNSFKWSCSKKRIMVQYAKVQQSYQTTYISVYDTSTLKLLYVHTINSYFPHKTDQFYGEIDCDNILYVSSTRKLQIVELSDKKIILPRRITKVNSIQLSSDGSQIAVLGLLNQNLILELFNDTAISQIFSLQTTSFKSNSRVFITTSGIYLLDQFHLFFFKDHKFNQIADNISDCQYFRQNSLLCIDLEGGFIHPNTTEIQHFSLGQINSKIKLSPQGNIVIIYNSTDFTIYDVLSDSLKLSQTVKFSTDEIAISSDNQIIITYNRNQQSFSRWRKNKCPPHSLIQNGQCKCIDDLHDNDGKCLCRSGEFMVGDECMECSFFCSECSESAGNCSGLSAGGIIVLIACLLAVLLIGFVALRCVRRWKGKKEMNEFQLTSNLEITDQYISIKQ